MYTEGIGYPIVNLKTDPEESEVLRRIYPVSGMAMNKRHWFRRRRRGIMTGSGGWWRMRTCASCSLPKAKKRPIEFRERPVPERGAWKSAFKRGQARHRFAKHIPIRDWRVQPHDERSGAPSSIPYIAGSVPCTTCVNT